ncbi:cyclic nucleotide-binding domain-containing protein [Flavobacterium psychrophilum]|uniref:Crp/Fnr family transcriptional regulator n=1 Tax=Flavobacterium psychrophilum TaxID=96345 RepID=UPI001D08B10A|nr:cyclic nucleotide-binding domain-containing protein [Flavobacterium psychrophilum]MCB6232016.1 cyclic nucleotide-binding domain-containing protein [Flavobacterium psychrophilum]
MDCELLIEYLSKKNTISEKEKEIIKSTFVPLKIKKKEVLINEFSQFNKLLFVTKGIMREYYINDNGKETIKIIAWENCFIINFKNITQNNKIIDCIEDAEILCISHQEFEKLLQQFPNLKSIYIFILEEYYNLHIMSFQNLMSNDMAIKMQVFKKNFPALINRVNDTILSSFLMISRETYVRNKKYL